MLFATRRTKTACKNYQDCKMLSDLHNFLCINEGFLMYLQKYEFVNMLKILSDNTIHIVQAQTSLYLCTSFNKVKYVSV